MSPALMCAFAAATAAMNSALGHARRSLRERSGLVGRFEAAAQRFDDPRAQRLPFALGAGVQQRDAPRQMIEDEQRFGCDIHRLGQAFELPGVVGQPLEEAHDVIAGRADEAAVERDAVDFRMQRRRAAEHVAHQRKPLGGVRGAFGRLAVDGEPVGVQLDGDAASQSDKRVPRQAFTALDAFEQEARAECFELHVRRYRGIEIGGDVER